MINTLELENDDNSLDINDDTYLDDNWIKEFKRVDKDYEIFYLDDVNFIKTTFIYIDKDNNIIKCISDKYLLKKPNRLFRDELLEILKKNIVMDGVKYTLFSILNYNINLDPLNIKNFITTKNVDSFCENFLKIVRNIDDIYLEKTINMFQDLNEIFIIFHENCEKSSSNSNPRTHNITKRVYLKNNSSHKKTIKK